MSSKANPTMIGAFVLGGAALLTVGVGVFGGGRQFADTETFVLFFEGSLKGLNVGAPVLFRGVKVGEVTDVRVRYHVEEQRIDIPVYALLQRDRIIQIGKSENREQNMPALVERGLRARLAMQSFVTGMLAVELDFHPGAPLRLVGGDSEFREVPTIPSAFDELTKTLQDIPIRELVEDLRRAVNGVDELVRSEDMRAAVRHIGAAAEAAGTLARQVNERVAELAARGDETLVQARSTLKTLEEKVASAEASFGDALGEVRGLARSLNERDDTVLKGIEEAAASARAALEQARLTLITANEVMTRDSEVRYHLTSMLEEVAAAARAVRALADYLERYPEALIRGKSGAAMP